MISASRVYESRRGRVTRRRYSAQPTPASTITATVFWSQVTAVQIAPSNGIESTTSMSPPVTMLAVSIVSRTKPQKIARWRIAARRIPEHPRLHDRVADEAGEAV